MKQALLLLVVIAILALSGAGKPSEAYHPYSQSPDPPAFRDQQWPDLEPGGDRTLNYWTCESYVPSFWTAGIEDKWDALIPGWSFTPVANCNAQAVLFWETPDPDDTRECGGGAYACNIKIRQPHADHLDIVRSEIWFDIDSANPYETWGPNFKTRIAAHEWGHNMGLEDHGIVDPPCVEDTLMISSDPAKKATDNPCDAGPTPQDLSSVRCWVYGYCGDFSGDTCADILARRTDNGTLRLYRGNCDGTIDGTSGGVIGPGWDAFNWLLRTGDIGGDGCTDVIARKPSGTLWHYVGTCAGGYEGVAPQIGNGGWQAFNWLVGPGDFNGDGCADILARKLSGVLALYHGDCDGGFPVSADIGPGWNDFNWMVGPGDFDGDGCPDLITRRADNGTLRLYNGNCQGGFAQGAGGVIGSGWNIFNSIAGPGDFSGDGCMDLIARRTDNGTLRLYRGNCDGTIDGTSGGVIGSGWNVFNWIF